MAEKIKIIIDTDIGDDIDDALAILLAVNSPELETLGITTVFGDVETRSQIAHKLLNKYGYNDIPVAAGREYPLKDSFYEGAGSGGCSQKEAVKHYPVTFSPHGKTAIFLKEQLEAYPDQINILTIGALSNIAEFVKMFPESAHKVKCIISNAGYLPPKCYKEAEFNIKYDIEAAQIIADSGIPWKLIGVDCCRNVALGPDEMAKMASQFEPSTEFLMQLIRLYDTNKRNNETPENFGQIKGVWTADASVALTLLHPDAIEFKRGNLSIMDDGLIKFEENPEGPHEFATSTFSKNLLDFLITRILAHN